MTEQIYINGTLMDMEGGKTVSLVFQSPFFTDIDSIVSNRTNSVDFPVTGNNLAATGNVHLSGAVSAFAYKRHEVIYCRDGVRIFKGYATLLAITPTSIKFSFTWGNVSAISRLLDRSIQMYYIHDKDFNEWEKNDVTDSGLFDMYVKWNVAGPGFASNIDTGWRPHPILRVSDILDKMEEDYGIVIEGKESFSNYRIPVLGNTSDRYAQLQAGTRLSSSKGHSVIVESSSYPNVWFNMLSINTDYPNYDSDPRELFNKEFSRIDVSAFDMVRIEWDDLSLLLGNADDLLDILTINGPNMSTVITYNAFGDVSIEHDEDGQCFAKVSRGHIDLDVSGIDSIYIVLASYPAEATNRNASLTSGHITIMPEYGEDAALVPACPFPLYRNLPDWDMAQLLKNLMKLEGLFAICPDDRTIRLVSIDALYDNRNIAVDVTERLILDRGRPDETTFTFGSYARKNWFLYSEDETVKTNADASMDIDNEALDAETDLVTLDFAACDEKDGQVSIPIYTSDGEGGYDYAEVTPRILKYTGKTDRQGEELTFVGLDWKTILEEKYKGYAASIERARVIKCSLLVDSLFLRDMDMSVPLYSYQLGHYYAIIQMTTKDNGVAEVQLLELGDI